MSSAFEAIIERFPSIFKNKVGTLALYFDFKPIFHFHRTNPLFP